MNLRLTPLHIDTLTQRSSHTSNILLQVWFQNARAKWRRHVLRQQSAGPHVVEESQQLMDLNSVAEGSPSSFSCENPILSEQAQFYFSHNDPSSAGDCSDHHLRTCSAGDFYSNSLSGSSPILEMAYASDHVNHSESRNLNYHSLSPSSLH